MPPADYVLIEVSDTGSGMPAEVVEKIYEPFFSTKEVGKGTGLGLSTVYGIIKQTGGFVYVDSTPGEGTAFRIYLPRHFVEVEAAASAAEGAVIAPKEPEKDKRPADLTGNGVILLVEDEDSLRSLNARGLRSRGYTVVEAENGLEALEKLEEQGGQIDLVVSDVVMPEMDGPTMLKEMRAKNPDIKIIFVSGYAEDAFEKSMPENQQFAFLPKPFTLTQLVGRVKETMTG
jgi:two-component system cell cycle sensor histidine kinase/response regulator CckA